MDVLALEEKQGNRCELEKREREDPGEERRAYREQGTVSHTTQAGIKAQGSRVAASMNGGQLKHAPCVLQATVRNQTRPCPNARVSHVDETER